MDSNFVPYLLRVKVLSERIAADGGFPFNLPFVAGLDLEIKKSVVFFVGENGTGKSTLIEALAALCRLPVSGGGRSELPDDHGTERESALSQVLRPSFRRQPRNGFFFRAEFQVHFATLLEKRELDPDFDGNPYELYGARSLHTRSHGEAFLAILQNVEAPGLYLLDEPESALSPLRQLALLALIREHANRDKAQFIIATHSPILMTYPDAQIVSFDNVPLRTIALEETSHYQITRSILENPGRYWKHL